MRRLSWTDWKPHPQPENKETQEDWEALKLLILSIESDGLEHTTKKAKSAKDIVPTNVIRKHGENT